MTQPSEGYKGDTPNNLDIRKTRLSPLTSSHERIRGLGEGVEQGCHFEIGVNKHALKKGGQVEPKSAPFTLHHPSIIPPTVSVGFLQSHDSIPSGSLQKSPP